RPLRGDGRPARAARSAGAAARGLTRPRTGPVAGANPALSAEAGKHSSARRRAWPLYRRATGGCADFPFPTIAEAKLTAQGAIGPRPERKGQPSPERRPRLWERGTPRAVSA